MLWFYNQQLQVNLCFKYLGLKVENSKGFVIHFAVRNMNQAKKSFTPEERIEMKEKFTEVNDW